MALVPWPMDISEFRRRYELYCVVIRIESLYCIGLRHYTVWIESLYCALLRCTEMCWIESLNCALLYRDVLD